MNLKVLDGGISQTSRDTFSKLIDRVRGVVRLEFVLMMNLFFAPLLAKPAVIADLGAPCARI